MRCAPFLLTSSVLLLCQCTIPPQSTGEKPVMENATGEKATASANLDMPGIDTRALNRLDATASPLQVTLPLLQSAALEKRWGKPKCSIAADGSYRLYYENPQRRFQALTIYGSPAKYAPAGPVPPDYMDVTFLPTGPTTAPVKQQWQNATVAGRSLRYCVTSPESGADVAEVTTETISLTGPDGRTASYCVAASSDQEKGPVSIESLFATAKF